MNLFIYFFETSVNLSLNFNDYKDIIFPKMKKREDIEE